MHYERVSLARRGGSWRMSYRAVYDAEHKGDRKWATIGAAAVLSAVEWPVVLSAIILSGILSLLVSIKGLPEVEKETANKN